MSEKRELVLKAFRGESVDRVPVGFGIILQLKTSGYMVLKIQELLIRTKLVIKILLQKSNLILLN